MLLRSHSFGGVGSARSHGILPLPVVPLVVWVNALETGGRADHQGQGPARYISKDRNQPATICPKVRRTFYTHPPSFGIGKYLPGTLTLSEFHPRFPFH